MPSPISAALLLLLFMTFLQTVQSFLVQRTPTTTTTRRIRINVRSAHRRSTHGHSNTTPRQTTHQYPILQNDKCATVKLFKQIITKRKVRYSKQLTLVEGPKVLGEVLDLQNSLQQQLVQHVIVNMSDEKYHLDHYSDLLERVNAQISIAGSDDIFSICSDTVTPQGISALCSIPESYYTHTSTSRRRLLISKQQKQTKNHNHRFYLIFDGVSDPGNAGTLLRSAVAVGVSGVIILPNSVDVWSPKTVRSAMGANYHVDIYLANSVEDCWDLLQQCGVPSHRIYAATMDDSGVVGSGGVSVTIDTQTTNKNSNTTTNNTNIVASSSPSLPHYDVNWVGDDDDDERGGGGVGVCIGQEGQGLSREVRDSVANGTISSVHVPMMSGVESLNAGVCGSVIMFEYARQRQLRDKLAS